MSQEQMPDVGAQLRAIRQRRGLSLRALAEICELSPNTIRLVEKGITSPSVSTLHRLATGLRVPITALFDAQPEEVRVIPMKADERPRTGSANVLLESLGRGLAKQTLEPFVVTLKPGAGSGRRSIVHAGHELVYCLEGEVEYVVDGDSHRLQIGDSLLFEATLPHFWNNPSGEAATFLLVFQATAPDESVAEHLNP